ncbi:mandelate racemase/muconate lactonizing enzyme family protein [Nitrospirillum viridazoti]|uniref:L-alanine-DL-glutamate epimerase-like enolase superfamily enzyme n=1 Tax=Nitrospirillum amazonense TaxID=28077 RepID=A0A560HVJ6_9PROT|nr:mandelate racemase/muconate lactonizing enzyme family protein [Nitrospirillum amazonense]TWB50662.1 L-alanine-DL-glutamate epimerase-like enolase superfamily enzyme [Nitrospirillum amazonense]
MEITSAKLLHADGGLKTLSFLKVETDAGIVGWSEFSEFIGSEGLGGIIERLMEDLIGQDPRRLGQIASRLQARSRLTAGGMSAQACAAIENALLDIKAKALGIPVYELLGGAVRNAVQVYWSHIGTYRVHDAGMFGGTDLRGLDDIKALGAEVKAAGVAALKTNIILFDDNKPANFTPGFRPSRGFPERFADDAVLRAALDQMSALRDGAGPDVRLILDVNFNFRPEGLRKLARLMEPFNLLWLEMDHADPHALAFIRRSTTTPVGSLESVYHRTGYRPFFEQQAVDVAIIDPMWNGVVESVKIADMADTYDVPVSSHGFTSHLGFMMCAHFCAAIPNFAFMEIDLDQPSWVPAFFTKPLPLHEGKIVLSDRPGWGIDVDEATLLAHPPRRKQGWAKRAAAAEGA